VVAVLPDTPRDITELMLAQIHGIPAYPFDALLTVGCHFPHSQRIH